MWSVSQAIRQLVLYKLCMVLCVCTVQHSTIQKVQYVAHSKSAELCSGICALPYHGPQEVQTGVSLSE